MRRIDLFCKLLAPILISLVDSLSTPIAIWTVFGVNLASVVVEYVAIAQVCQASCSPVEGVFPGSNDPIRSTNPSPL